MKNVLLLVHDDPGQEARLQAALDVSRAVGGHLSCLEVIVPPVAIAYDPWMGSASGELMTMACEQESKNRDRIKARLTHEDIAWSWKESIGFPEELLVEAAALADVIVLSSHLERRDPPELDRIAGNVACRTNRPVLAVPMHVRGIDVSGTVLVAWDASRQADDALREAVPLLRCSDRVVVMDLDNEQGSFAAADAAIYLSRHGVHAQIETVAREPGELLYTSILNRAHDLCASYIVMGAFGHSRMTEAVFGGVTRSMLAHSDLPLFLAH